MKIFVTGAAGFTGRAVVAELANRGHEVVGLVHKAEDGKLVEKLGGRYIEGDLMKKGSWVDEVQSSYRVISLSWPVKITDRLNIEDMADVNVKHAQGVTNLIRAAKHGEAKSILVTYDTLCMGDVAGKWIEEPGAFNPTGFCRPIGNSFEEIGRAGKDAGIPLVNIFPARVYGNGGWFALMVERIRQGSWRMAGKGDNYLSLIHLEDLAWAYGEAAERLTHEESFALADGNPGTQAELMNYVSELLGVAHPEPMDYHEFADKEGIMLAESLAASAKVSGSKAARLLDFEPRYANFRDGVLAVLKGMGIEPVKKAA